MATDAKRIFGQVLRKARVGRGISQEELSAQSGVSVDSISRAERAIAVPGWEAVLDLSEVLGVTPADFAPAGVAAAAVRQEARAELARLTEGMSLGEISKVLEQARLIAGRRK